MDVSWVRQHCLSFPHATEHIQWGNDLVFKIGGKMFAVTALEPAAVWLSFKVSETEFGELIDTPGIISAPYLARAHWVALQTPDALSPTEIKSRLARAYELVRAGLPQKARAALS